MLRLCHLQEYIRQIGKVLLELQGDLQGPVMHQLELLASECVMFMGCVCVVNPAVLMAAYQGQIDEHLAARQKLDTALHVSCLVSHLKLLCVPIGVVLSVFSPFLWVMMCFPKFPCLTGMPSLESLCSLCPKSHCTIADVSCKDRHVALA